MKALVVLHLNFLARAWLLCLWPVVAVAAAVVVVLALILDRLQLWEWQGQGEEEELDVLLASFPSW